MRGKLCFLVLARICAHMAHVCVCYRCKCTTARVCCVYTCTCTCICACASVHAYIQCMCVYTSTCMCPYVQCMCVVVHTLIQSYSPLEFSLICSTLSASTSLIPFLNFTSPCTTHRDGRESVTHTLASKGLIWPLMFIMLYTTVCRLLAK